MRVRLSGVVMCLGVVSAWAERPQDYQARLSVGLASYSKAGTQFEARIMGTVDAGEAGEIPQGSTVEGRVRRAHSIGIGVRRERAVLELEFSKCRLADGSDLGCKAELIAVDNARERVVKPNEVEGILAASHPYSWLSGVWYRPLPSMFGKAPAGLTGAGGMLHNRLATSPWAAAAIVGTRLLVFRMPEPEIELPAGTDLILRIAVEAGGAGSAEVAEREPGPEDESMEEALKDLPVEVELPDGQLASDIINLAIIGSKDEIVRAFGTAGWTLAEPLSKKSFARTYSAFALMKSYPNAPVSALFYDGRAPELVLQKSLNTLAKRHHVRLWQGQADGREVWLGAATHDVGLIFDRKRMRVTHRIDPNVDNERHKIINDLAGSGCLEGVRSVAREETRRKLAERGAINTNGALTVVTVRECGVGEGSTAAAQKPRRRLVLLAARRLILETRHYLTRGSAYYWGFRAVSWAFSGKGEKLNVRTAQGPRAPMVGDDVVLAAAGSGLP